MEGYAGNGAKFSATVYPETATVKMLNGLLITAITALTLRKITPSVLNKRQVMRLPTHSIFMLFQTTARLFQTQSPSA